MAKWNEGKKAEIGGFDITRLDYKSCPLKIRLVGEYLPRYHYWLKTSEGNNRTVECLGFNRETEAFDTPKDDLIKGKLDERGEEIKPQFAYAVQCIDRADGQIKILELKKTIFNEIIKFAQSEYGNPGDEINGYDITISKEKTGPLPMNVKYSLLPARKLSPLTDKEKELKLFDLEKIYKRPTKEAQEEWLRANTKLLDGDNVDTEVLDAVTKDIPVDDDNPF